MTALPKLAAPAQRALTAAGISTLEQLSKHVESEIAQLHGMGPNALAKLHEALKANSLAFKHKGGKKSSKQKQASPVSRTDKVDEYMAALKHPLKVEAEAIRKIIMGVNEKITEAVKWNAPSFSYKGEYLVTFNLRDTKQIHLVFHNPMIAKVKSKILEGDYKDRRMAYFADSTDIQVKERALIRALKDLIKLQEK